MATTPAERLVVDPLNVIEHKLPNGLTLFMSVNKLEPRVFTNIAVRAGSKHDPAETTGLAHYLEHMLFKGTSNIGTLNWEQESKLLQQISDLYEAHRRETDPDKRKAIYKQIDSVSFEASKLVVPNEYDKMVSGMGAKATNAYTSVEQTVYVNDIPANELERWMRLEAERFRMVVLRLFHTELEAVYEEFNINQDRDFRKTMQAMSEVLFPTHPYGTQTTIGRGEHLKNPSHVNIQNYFAKYYVPNNMAIVLSGDFDPSQAVAWAEKYFGSYTSKAMDRPSFAPQPELKQVVRRTVTGQESPWVQMGWRVNGAKSPDQLMAKLISGLMYNQQAGLFDLNLIQQQKVLEASTYTFDFEDYGVLGLYGKPRDGQTLQEVEQLMLEQLDKIRKGDFPDWLPGAVIKDMKLSQTRGYENNSSRVSAMTNAFIVGTSWTAFINSINTMAGFSKQDIMRFAERFLRNDNYVVVYKESGEDKNVVKVEKPTITPVQLNRDMETPFVKSINGMSASTLSPEFLEYDKLIAKTQLSDKVVLEYSKNTANETFSLYYLLEMGTNADPKLDIALTYLPYLGTDKYTPEQLQQEFYKLGLSFEVFSGTERSYVILAGLDESFEQGVALFEHVLANVVANKEALDNLVADRLQQQVNAKKDKRVILREAMAGYARYGKVSPFTDKLKAEQLRALTPDQMVGFIKSLTSYDHRVFYYGSRSMDNVATVLKRAHQVPAQLKPVMPNKQYAELPTAKNRVVFVDFPMVQAEILMLSKGADGFNTDEFIMSDFFNTYFGAGLSSVVFQEIRESRALAYSANAFYATPARTNRGQYFQAYVGTQADKMPEAVSAMRAIIEDMPVSPDRIENTRQSILKRIESERITRTNVYFNRLANLDRGINYDLRRDQYTRLQKATAQDLVAFHKKHVKDRGYVIMVLGSKANVNMDYLKSLGPVEELTLEQVFGY